MLRSKRAWTYRSAVAIQNLTVRDGKRASESVIAIRPKSSFRRASARLQRGNHKNFFVAKPCDSESVRTAF
jgi:hypothetical protein